MVKKIEKSKILLLKESLKTKIKRKISLKDIPIVSFSCLSLLMVSGLNLLSMSLPHKIETIDGIMIGVQFLLTSYLSFHSSLYFFSGKKTLKELENDNFSNIIRNIDTSTLYNGRLNISIEKNQEFMNILMRLSETHFDKKTMDEVLKNVLSEIDRYSLENILNSEELIEVKKESGISSGRYLYLLILKVEEYLFFKNNSEDQLDGVIGRDYDLEESYILGFAKNENNKVEGDIDMNTVIHKSIKHNKAKNRRAKLKAEFLG